MAALRRPAGAAARLRGAALLRGPRRRRHRGGARLLAGHGQEPDVARRWARCGPCSTTRRSASWSRKEPRHGERAARAAARHRRRTAPTDDRDLAVVLRGGRRRVRRRRLAVVGGTALATAAVVATASVVWTRRRPTSTAAGVPAPGRADAAPGRRARGGRGARLPRARRRTPTRTSTRTTGSTSTGSPTTGWSCSATARAWTSAAAAGPAGPGHRREGLAARPRRRPGAAVAGRARRGPAGAARRAARRHASVQLVAHVFDRERRQWSTIDVARPARASSSPDAVLGPDDRLYVRVPATAGAAAARAAGRPARTARRTTPTPTGDTYRLWSASLTDPADVRDEGLTVGDVAFTDTLDGVDRPHQRRQRAGARPRPRDRRGARLRPAVRVRAATCCPSAPRPTGSCSGSTAAPTTASATTGCRCVSTDGDQVVTVQDSDLDGGLGVGSDVVTVTSYQRGTVRDLRLRPRRPTGSCGSATTSPAGRRAVRPSRARSSGTRRSTAATARRSGWASWSTRDATRPAPDVPGRASCRAVGGAQWP